MPQDLGGESFVYKNESKSNKSKRLEEMHGWDLSRFFNKNEFDYVFCAFFLSINYSIIHVFSLLPSDFPNVFYKGHRHYNGVII
jgi:hypothetical protein